MIFIIRFVICDTYSLVLHQFVCLRYSEEEKLSASYGVSPVKSGVGIRDTFPDAEGKYSSLELLSEPYNN